MCLKISCALIFWFGNSNVTTFQIPENVKISIFPFTLSREKCYIFKSIWRIFKNILFAERLGRWVFWLKISSAQIFWFCDSNVTPFPKSRKCKNFNFSLYTVPAEMLYLQKYLTNFQKLFFGWKMRRWLLWLKMSCAQIFWFGNSNVTTFPKSRKGKNFNFSLYTVLSRNAISSKVFKRIFKNFFLAERWRKDRYCRWKFHWAQIFWVLQ